MIKQVLKILLLLQVVRSILLIHTDQITPRQETSGGLLDPQITVPDDIQCQNVCLLVVLCNFFTFNSIPTGDETNCNLYTRYTQLASGETLTDQPGLNFYTVCDTSSQIVLIPIYDNLNDYSTTITSGQTQEINMYYSFNQNCQITKYILKDTTTFTNKESLALSQKNCTVGSEDATEGCYKIQVPRNEPGFYSWEIDVYIPWLTTIIGQLTYSIYIDRCDITQVEGLVTDFQIQSAETGNFIVSLDKSKIIITRVMRPTLNCYNYWNYASISQVAPNETAVITQSCNSGYFVHCYQAQGSKNLMKFTGGVGDNEIIQYKWTITGWGETSLDITGTIEVFPVSECSASTPMLATPQFNRTKEFPNSVTPTSLYIDYFTTAKGCPIKSFKMSATSAAVFSQSDCPTPANTTGCMTQSIDLNSLLGTFPVQFDIVTINGYELNYVAVSIVIFDCTQISIYQNINYDLQLPPQSLALLGQAESISQFIIDDTKFQTSDINCPITKFIVVGTTQPAPVQSISQDQACLVGAELSISCRTINIPTDKIQKFTYDLKIEAAGGVNKIYQGLIDVQCSNLVNFITVPTQTEYVFDKTLDESGLFESIVFETSQYVTSVTECTIEKFIFEDTTPNEPGLPAQIGCEFQNLSQECRTVQIPTDTTRVALGILGPYKFSMIAQIMGGKQFKLDLTASVKLNFLDETKITSDNVNCPIIRFTIQKTNNPQSIFPLVLQTDCPQPSDTSVQCRTIAYPKNHIQTLTFSVTLEALGGVTHVESGSIEIVCSSAVVVTQTEPIQASYSFYQTQGVPGYQNIVYENSQFAVDQELCPIEKFSLDETTIGQQGLILSTACSIPQDDSLACRTVMISTSTRRGDGDDTLSEIKFTMKVYAKGGSSTQVYASVIIELDCRETIISKQSTYLLEGAFPLTLTGGTEFFLINMTKFSTNDTNCPIIKYVVVDTTSPPIASSISIDPACPVDGDLSENCRRILLPSDKPQIFTYNLTVEVPKGIQKIFNGEIKIECSDVITFTKVPEVTEFSFTKTLLGSNSIQEIIYEVSQYEISEIMCPIEKFIFEDLTSSQPFLLQVGCSTQDTNLACRTIQIPTDVARSIAGPLLPFEFSLKTQAKGGIESQIKVSVTIECSIEVQIIEPAIISSSALQQSIYSNPIYILNPFESDDKNCPITSYKATQSESSSVLQQPDCPATLDTSEACRTLSFSSPGSYIVQFEIEALGGAKITTKTINFEVVNECQISLSISISAQSLFSELFRDTTEKKKLFNVSTLFTSTNQTICPIKEKKLMNQGCNEELQSQIIEMLSSGDVVASTNQKATTKKIFCVMIKNDFQELKIDNIEYNQTGQVSAIGVPKFTIAINSTKDPSDSSIIQDTTSNSSNTQEESNQNSNDDSSNSSSSTIGQEGIDSNNNTNGSTNSSSEISEDPDLSGNNTQSQSSEQSSQNQDQELQETSLLQKHNERVAQEKQAIKDQQLKEQGMEPTWAGYTFPGIDPLAIEQAKKNKQNALVNEFKPEPMKVKFYQLDQFGTMRFIFSQELMIPNVINQNFWDSLFRVYLIDINSGRVIGEKFNYLNNRLLQNSTQETEQNKFSFNPSVISFDENQITIKLDFKDLKQFSVGGIAEYEIEVLEPSLFKTKLLMEPLSQNDFFNGQTKITLNVPPQVQDVALAKSFTEAVKSNTDGLQGLTVGSFIILILQSAGMQKFWGSIRTLQTVFFISLVKFDQTPLLLIFLQICENFAKQDVLNGEELIGLYMVFKQTRPINQNFATFDHENMIMMSQSGSFFILMIIFTISYILFATIHKLAVKIPKFWVSRFIGRHLEGKNRGSNAIKLNQKLMIEGYFDISIAVFVNVCGFMVYHNTLVEFFEGWANIINSILTIFLLFVFPSFIYYAATLIRKYQSDLKKREVKERLENFIEQLHCKTYYSSLNVVFFLLRRLVTSITLVFLVEYPSIQITALTNLSFVFIIYYITHKPFQGISENINEAFNEFCVLICMYLINTLMISSNLDFSQDLTYIFIVVCISNIVNYVVQTLYVILKETFRNFLQKIRIRMESRKIKDDQKIDVVAALKADPWNVQRNWLNLNKIEYRKWKQEIDFQEKRKRLIALRNRQIISKMNKRLDEQRKKTQRLDVQRSRIIRKSLQNLKKTNIQVPKQIKYQPQLQTIEEEDEEPEKKQVNQPQYFKEIEKKVNQNVLKKDKKIQQITLKFEDLDSDDGFKVINQPKTKKRFFDLYQSAEPVIAKDSIFTVKKEEFKSKSKEKKEVKKRGENEKHKTPRKNDTDLAESSRKDEKKKKKNKERKLSKEEQEKVNESKKKEFRDKLARIQMQIQFSFLTPQQKETYNIK